MVTFSMLRPSEIASLTGARSGETKLGDLVQTVPDLEAVARSSARFVLLGIPEDIGIRANLGVGGAASVWKPALKALMNIQVNERIDGNALLALGAFDFSALMGGSYDLTELRRLTEEIDQAVIPIVEQIVAAGKVPIIIGGGHNNAYPLIKASASAFKEAIHAINLDAHSDYRIAEGRHSGNGFRYARQDGLLDRYAVVGLHENYNNQRILADMDADPNIHYSRYEDIFIHEQLTFRQAVAEAIAHTAGGRCGIELDLDCIAGVLSSAATPCGISPLQARQYVHWCASEASPVYLHLAEGAVRLADGREDPSTAKLIAYIISDFLKAAR